jgi:hypothetical protein
VQVYSTHTQKQQISSLAGNWFCLFISHHQTNPWLSNYTRSYTMCFTKTFIVITHCIISCTVIEWCVGLIMANKQLKPVTSNWSYLVFMSVCTRYVSLNNGDDLLKDFNIVRGKDLQSDFLSTTDNTYAGLSGDGNHQSLRLLPHKQVFTVKQFSPLAYTLMR